MPPHPPPHAAGGAAILRRQPAGFLGGQVVKEAVPGRPAQFPPQRLPRGGQHAHLLPGKFRRGSIRPQRLHPFGQRAHGQAKAVRHRQRLGIQLPVFKQTVEQLRQILRRQKADRGLRAAGPQKGLPRLLCRKGGAQQVALHRCVRQPWHRHLHKLRRRVVAEGVLGVRQQGVPVQRRCAQHHHAGVGGAALQQHPQRFQRAQTARAGGQRIPEPHHPVKGVVFQQLLQALRLLPGQRQQTRPPAAAQPRAAQHHHMAVRKGVFHKFRCDVPGIARQQHLHANLLPSIYGLVVVYAAPHAKNGGTCCPAEKAQKNSRRMFLRGKKDTYFAYSVARLSRMTLTLIWPG